MPAPLTAHPPHTDHISLRGDYSSCPPAGGKAVVAVNGGRNTKAVFVRNGTATSDVRSLPQLPGAGQQPYAYIQHAYTYQHRWMHRSARTEMLRARANAESMDGLILFLPSG